MYKFCPNCGTKNDNHKYCGTCGGSLIEEPDIIQTTKKKIQIVNEQPLENNKLDEIRDLLKQHKSISEIKTKIKTWKDEGYNVSELENMIENIYSDEVEFVESDEVEIVESDNVEIKE